MIIKKDPDSLRNYLEDSSNLKGGHAEEIAVPANIDELSAYLRESDSHRRPVTISGGGTGTTGSRIPFGGAVVSLEKFNRILGVSDRGMFAVVETGVFVDDLKKVCDARGLFYTSHPTENTATVGGTVATNASGSRSFKYGPTRRYVRRLKMVLPSGEILDLRRGERTLSKRDPLIRLPSGRRIIVPLTSYRMPDVKHAAGYYAYDGMDLIDLFIGQEGTLSVITEIEIGLEKRPEKILSAFAFFKNEEDAWDFSMEARERSKKGPVKDAPAIDALSIEYFDRNALNLLRVKSPNVPGAAAAAIFFEQEIREGGEDRLVSAWLDLIARHGASLDDTWVAMNEKDAAGFTAFRHAIPEAVNDIVRKNGFQKLSTDIAVPGDKFLEMMRYYRDALVSGGLEHVVFGHMGECHVHANVLPRSEAEAAKAREMVMSFIKKGVSLGGTVSAEHGIGKIKHAYLEAMYGGDGIRQMARIKKALDPNCILGLDTIFSRKALEEV